MSKRARNVLLTLFSISGFLALSAHAEEAPTVIASGSRVSVEYTLTLADGTVADTNVGGQALVYTQGQSQILPNLEKQLSGMKVGESKQVSLTAADGYGEVDQALFQAVPIASIPEDARSTGTQLVAQAPTGEPVLSKRRAPMSVDRHSTATSQVHGIELRS